MDPGEIFRAHHISNFGKENTRDNRLHWIPFGSKQPLLHICRYLGCSNPFMRRVEKLGQRTTNVPDMNKCFVSEKNFPYFMP